MQQWSDVMTSHVKNTLSERESQHMKKDDVTKHESPHAKLRYPACPPCVKSEVGHAEGSVLKVRVNRNCPLII